MRILTQIPGIPHFPSNPLRIWNTSLSLKSLENLDPNPRSWRLGREDHASSVLWPKQFHPHHVWRRNFCSRRSWDARPGSFERARLCPDSCSEVVHTREVSKSAKLASPGAVSSSYRFCYHFWNWLSHLPRVWRRSSCSRRSWGARPGAFERARRLLQLFANFLGSKRKTQLESKLTRVRGNPHSPKSAVRGRHVRCFESTWQISNRSIYSPCAQLFVLSGVSGTRFLELEPRLRKKQRRQVLRIPKGAHTKHLHVTTSAAHWVLTGIRLLNSSS